MVAESWIVLVKVIIIIVKVIIIIIERIIMMILVKVIVIIIISFMMTFEAISGGKVGKSKQKEQYSRSGGG